MFDAKQAKELANKHTNYENAVAKILDGVHKQAVLGSYTYITRDYEFGSGKCYTTEDKYPEDCKKILEKLRSLGFNCQVRCKEMQFVDMWLEVSWK